MVSCHVREAISLAQYPLRGTEWIREREEFIKDGQMETTCKKNTEEICLKSCSL